MFLAVSEGEIMLYAYDPQDCYLNRVTDFISLYRASLFLNFQFHVNRLLSILMKRAVRLLLNAACWMFPALPVEWGSLNLLFSRPPQERSA